MAGKCGISSIAGTLVCAICLSAMGEEIPVGGHESLTAIDHVDFNGDGIVNYQDLNILGNCWYSGGAPVCDLNGDGVTNGLDVVLFGQYWFRVGAKSSSESKKTKDGLGNVLGVDLEPGNPRFASPTSVNVIDEDVDIDTAMTVAVGDEFTALVRLNGAENLRGVGFDLAFDEKRLEVLEFRETRMDLDYDGKQSLDEKTAIQAFYEAFTYPDVPLVNLFSYSFDTGEGPIGTYPGYLMDFISRNGILDPAEMNAYLSEYAGNQTETDIPFWTEVVSRRPGYNESVEFVAPLGEINASGQALDNVSLLLKRPGTPLSGFGFDGDGILFEIRFRALQQGMADIGLFSAWWIDEDFADINTDVLPVSNVMSSSLVTISSGPPRTLAPTPTQTKTGQLPTTTPSHTRTPTLSPTPSYTATATETNTETPIPTQTLTRTPTMTVTSLQTETPTQLPNGLRLFNLCLGWNGEDEPVCPQDLMALISAVKKGTGN